jgi:ribosomal protein S18 acetylase RimI-like enzyme
VTSDVTTRPAVDADRPFVIGVFLRSMRESIAASRGAWDEVRERDTFEGQLDLQRTTIIERGATAVGFVMLGDLVGALQIHTIAIAPEHQNGGIGSDVLTDLVQIGRQTGREVILSVLKSNSRAEALYARLGFVVVEESPTHRHMRFVETRDVSGP